MGTAANIALGQPNACNLGGISAKSLMLRKLSPLMARATSI